MSKFIVLLYIIFYAVNSQGSGKLTLQPMYDIASEKQLTPQIGLSIYEKFPMNAAYVGWFGTGEPLVQGSESSRWYTSKNSLEVYVNKFTINSGIQHIWKETEGFDKKTGLVFVKISYQLW